MKKIKEILKSPQLKYGTYSTVVTVVAIAVIVLVNMIVGKFSENIDNIDLSDSKIYEITDTTKEILADLEHDIQFIVLAEKDSVDERISIFVEKYAALSKKIDLEWIDPVEHPSALTEYDAASNSIVVVCEDLGRQEVVSMEDMIVYDYTNYYYTGYADESGFDAEGQLTSAVSSVISETSKKIYCTTGHGEASFGTTILDLLDKSNFTTEEINTLMATEIPEDCDLLFLHAPTTDLTGEELNLIAEYLRNGGDVFYILAMTSEETPNLDALLAEYGMQKANGYIADTQRNYQGNYYYIFPQLSVSGELANDISTEMVLLIQSLGMTETEPARDTISLEVFMETSSAGYAVNGDDAVEGQYVLGAVATEEESQFTVIASQTMIEGNLIDSFGTLENATLFMNAVTNHFDDVVNISIPEKSLAVTYNSVQHAGLFGILFIFGVPLFALGFGFVTWLKRRKA